MAFGESYVYNNLIIVDFFYKLKIFHLYIDLYGLIKDRTLQTISIAIIVLMLKNME
jgi:hypothetical protein